jgi:hypothetical protein
MPAPVRVLEFLLPPPALDLVLLLAACRDLLWGESEPSKNGAHKTNGAASGRAGPESPRQAMDINTRHDPILLNASVGAADGARPSAPWPRSW